MKAELYDMECRPEICNFPKGKIPTGTRWTCPRCGFTYIRRGPVPERPWRNWYAPDGYWVLTWRDAIRVRRTTFPP